MNGNINIVESVEILPHTLKINIALLLMTCNEFRFHAEMWPPITSDYVRNEFVPFATKNA